MANGQTRIDGLLEADDVLASAGAMRAFGADVERIETGQWVVEGSGAFTEPAGVIDCGNAGTGVRLIMGAAAGFDLAATFTGDASLRDRPMDRILAPLSLMGARWIARAGGYLPLTLHGGRLRAIDYAPPQPSAQVKSAVLLAGLNADGQTSVVEALATRDHTERMLLAFGARVEVEQAGAGRIVRLEGGQKLKGAAVRVPGDPSSAAFPIVAALITPNSEVTVEGVLLNLSRTGLLETLREMGADIDIADVREDGGESVGDVTARSSRLRGVTVPPGRAPAMIDEYPILAVAAAFAEGTTVMRGIGELRIKESDRIARMATGLAACGVEAREEREGLLVNGAGHRGVRGGALAFLVLGLGAGEPVGVDEAGMIVTSFPGFRELLAGLGATIEPS
jgi:3-phosphoshikimate 1-carboxyvinyltransferase